CLLGWQGAAPAGVRSVETLEATALACLEALGTPAPKLERPAIPWRPRRRAGGVRGFYTGGSLCEEARGLVGPGPHRFVDFGDAQGLAVQERALAALDAVVCASNRIAAEVARELAEGAGGR